MSRLSAPLAGLNRDLDRIVEATPPERDRFVDFLRALAITVVVVWHWALSLLNWDGGELTMPNPIPVIPGGWLATWLLQIMPLFFVVGGFANLAAWQGVRRRGEGPGAFLRRRLRRLLVPVAVFAACWAVFEVVAHLAVEDYPGVHLYGWVVLMPLWFLAAYVGVILLVPLTAPLHERAGGWALLGLGVAVLAVDAVRFGADVEAAAWANSALVWVFAHQVGYAYRDGTLTRSWPWRQVAVAAGGAAALAVLTSLDAYPRSMVAVPGQETSNIYPTNATIAAVAVFQAGMAMLVRPLLSGWLRRWRVWKTVAGVNAVIMTVFVWHMTALLVVVAVLGALGAELITEPTLQWWLQRPFWLVAPALPLALFVALFARFEVGRRGPGGR